jgi:hypothetical protein
MLLTLQAGGRNLRKVNNDKNNFIREKNQNQRSFLRSRLTTNIRFHGCTFWKFCLRHMKLLMQSPSRQDESYASFPRGGIFTN